MSNEHELPASPFPWKVLIQSETIVFANPEYKPRTIRDGRMTVVDQAASWGEFVEAKFGKQGLAPLSGERYDLVVGRTMEAVSNFMSERFPTMNDPDRSSTPTHTPI